MRPITRLYLLHVGGMRRHGQIRAADLDDRLTITIRRTAEVLDVGRSTVYELLRTGKLKGVKFGRAHRVVVQSIRDLIAECTPMKQELTATLGNPKTRSSEAGEA